MRLAGKTALITGAASGLGAATARRFAQEGADTVIADLLTEEGMALAGELRGAEFHPLDVSDAHAWERAVNAIMDRFGRLDILVNNAGIGPGTPELLDIDAWDRQIAINARGAFLGMRAVVPHMRNQGSGAIVNIASIAAKVGQGLHLGYGASKSAILGISKAAAVAYAPDGVRVNAILPGVMPPMRNSANHARPGRRQKMLESVPMGRLGKVEDVANAALFLASDEAAYITGAELAVDGGYLAR